MKKLNECKEKTPKGIIRLYSMIQDQRQLMNAYISYIREFDTPPENIHAFKEYAGDTLTPEFDQVPFPGPFHKIERIIVKNLFLETLDVLHGDEIYTTYNTREKLLALYYTWFQTLYPVRDFILYLWATYYKPWPLNYTLNGSNFTPKLESPLYFDEIYDPFTNYLEVLIENGMDQGEIAGRFGFKAFYKSILWQQTIFLFNFWMTDTSEQFEKTDAAVEKSINFTVDVMQPNLFDTGIDWIKFILQDI